MRFFMSATVVAAACFSSGAAFAQRAPVPVINHENMAVMAAPGTTPTADQVRQAIEAAALSREWEVKEVAPGQIVASLSVRNKHQVSTDIAYSATAYSIRYRDSVNMKYKPAETATGADTGTIHPFYNRWVQDLNQAIRLSLSKIS